MVILFALLYLVGTWHYAMGLKYEDEVAMFNGKALWIYGAVGMMFCVIRASLL